MPTPNPSKETKKEFVQRCIPFLIKEGKTKDNKQAFAICNSMWDQHKKNKKSRAEEIAESVQKNLLEDKNG